MESVTWWRTHGSSLSFSSAEVSVEDDRVSFSAARASARIERDGGCHVAATHISATFSSLTRLIVIPLISFAQHTSRRTFLRDAEGEAIPVG